MLKELIEKQKQALIHFFDVLSLEEIEKVVEECLNCRGALIFTGVGKSGLIAQKIAVTMVSTGTKAFYLSPMDAIHGDLGMVTKEDVIIMLSKGGESDEMIQLIPYLRNKGAKIISFTCRLNSRLAKAADVNLLLPLERELCPYDMAPTTSTTIQLMIGDILAIAIMRHKNFSLDQFALNHPGGRLGRQMTTRVKDLMLRDRDVPLCSAENKLIEVLVELSNKKCGCILIIDKEKKLEGIFTDGDLRRALQKEGPQVLEKPMGSLMNPKPRCISQDILALEAMKMMEADQKHPIMVLPVLDEKQVVGIIKMHDIIQSGL